MYPGLEFGVLDRQVSRVRDVFVKHTGQITILSSTPNTRR